MSLLNHILAKRTELEAIAEKTGVSNIRVVGSVARGEEREDSDIDLLVDFDPSIAGGIAIGGFQYEASELLGRHVDVLMSGNKYHPLVREGIMRDAIAIERPVP